MSAYALPGFFPPIDETCNRNSNGFTSLDNALFGSNNQSIGGGGNIGTTPPLHIQDPSPPPCHGGIHCLLLRSAVDRFCPTNVLLCGPLSSSSAAFSPISSTSSDSSPCHEMDHQTQQPQSDTNITSNSSSFSTLIVAVKEAKIDPVRLIQYLTGTTPQHSHRKTLRRRGSQERLQTSSGMGGGAAGSQNSPIRHNRPLVQLPTALAAPGVTAGEVGTDHKNAGAAASATENPHGGAIEFELSISFQGRKYTAKRTLQCIIQLRDDLIREMRCRKQWLIRERSSKGYNDNEGPSIGDDPPTGHHQDCRRTTGLPPFTMMGGGGASSHGPQQDPNEYIPEIPPLTTGDDRGSFSGGKGFVGRGFTMLHAMVTLYVPVMERWLKNVMTIVPPDSECLMDFLWEPSEATTSLEDFASKVSCSSLATLGSIKELDYDTEDSEDEDVGYCETSWDGS
jgi:hypothetical protein